MTCPDPGGREANDGPERNDARSAAENQLQHVHARGAQRNANAELAHALLNGIHEDAEDPDQRECQGERSECRDDDGAESMRALCHARRSVRVLSRRTGRFRSIRATASRIGEAP